jgi:hypothetical protein
MGYNAELICRWSYDRILASTLLYTDFVNEKCARHNLMLPKCLHLPYEQYLYIYDLSCQFSSP